MSVLTASEKPSSKKIAVFVSGDLSYYEREFDYFVGVDRACLFVLEKGLSLDMAVGDFDSVTLDEKNLIKARAKKVLEASPEKDDTDTELALKTIWSLYPTAQVTVFGAFGGRMDHTLSNLFLPSDEGLAPFMRQLCLKDATNHISYYPKGRHELLPDDMTYISFMTSGNGTLIIKGAKYELDESNYFKKKIYSSNEFLNQPIILEVEDDYAVVIRARDKS